MLENLSYQINKLYYLILSLLLILKLKIKVKSCLCFFNKRQGFRIKNYMSIQNSIQQQFSYLQQNISAEPKTPFLDINWAYGNHLYYIQMQRNFMHSNDKSRNQIEMFHLLQHNAPQFYNCWQPQFYSPYTFYLYPQNQQEIPGFCVLIANQQQNQQRSLQRSKKQCSGEAEGIKRKQKAKKSNENKPKQATLRQSNRRRAIQLQNINENEGNRNVLSNSLKLALKNIRKGLQNQSNDFKKITEYNKLHISIEQFLEKLNQLLPPDINYIRPSMIKQIFEQQQKQFTLVLKILIRKFFKQDIYKYYGKETKMKKLVRAHHIRAGRKLLNYFSQSNEANSQASLSQP